MQALQAQPIQQQLESDPKLESLNTEVRAYAEEICDLQTTCQLEHSGRT